MSDATPNPNPARITQAMWDLWLGFKAIEPTVQLGGIYANKPGYHNTRAANAASNYSVAQFAADRQGPNDKAAAIDLTFPSAQGGNYALIALYSARLLAAGKAKDPRTRYMREFFGQTDNDLSVEGWDFARGSAASSDSSHLWHIHISIHRAYVADPAMTRAILSILRGETLAQWLAREGNTELSWKENLTAGADGGHATFEAGAWLIGTNIAAWNAVNRLGQIEAKLAELEAPRASVDIAALVAALEPKLAAVAEAAAERAMRRIMLDAATPDAK